MTSRCPRLLAISDRNGLGDLSFEDWFAALAAAGVDAVQIREKDLDDRALLELTARARSALPASTRVLVNGRADVALAAGADGVHLPAAEVPVAALRRRFGDELLIGRSTHRPAEVERARDEGADYVTFGPVYATPSKAAYGPPPGIAGLQRAAAVGLPVVALGGVTIARLPEVAAAGARGAAGIRVFHDPAALGPLAAEAARLFPR